MRTGVFVSVSFTLALIGCDGSSSTRPPVHAPNPQDSAVSNQPGTFHVAKADDLDAPLFGAFSDAINAGLPTFTVVLAPGKYDVQSVTLIDHRGDASTIEVRFESSGDEPAVLTGRLHIEANAVTVRGVVIDGARTPAAPLTIRVAKSLSLDRVAVVGSTVADSTSSDPIVELTSGFGGRATASIKDSWFVQNQTVARGGAAVTLTADAGLAFTSISLDNVVLAGNVTSASLEPQYGIATALSGVALLEPQVRGPVIHMISPMTKVSITGGVLAAKGPAIGYDVNRDVARQDYTTISITGTRLAEPVPAADAVQKDIQTGVPAIDWNAIAAAARQDQPPDLAKLGF